MIKFYMLIIGIAFVGSSPMYAQELVDTIQSYEGAYISDTAWGGQIEVITNKPYERPLNQVYYLKLYTKDSVLIQECLSYNGYYVGVWKDYYDNGNLKTEGLYSGVTYKKKKIKKKPKKTGDWIFYTKSGKIIRRETYQNGKKIGVTNR